MEKPVHGSAKLCVVAVRSPEWLVPEGTSSGRALFFFVPLWKAFWPRASQPGIAGDGVILSPRADFAIGIWLQGFSYRGLATRYQPLVLKGPLATRSSAT